MKRLLLYRSAAIPFLMCIGFTATAGLPVVWNVRTSPVSSQLNAVTYGNGLFVAAAPPDQILISSNGWDWIVRPTGIPNASPWPTFYTGTYGAGRFVLGGGIDALIRSSTDGLHWTNGLSGGIYEAVRGITFGRGLFVAVGSGAEFNTPWILTSSNGLDWASQNVPNRQLPNNQLLGVAASGTNGAPSYVAVGYQGTILSSSNGANWSVRNSGTTVTLRCVLRHQGRFLVGGDFGTILTSTDGINWTAAASASFTVHAMASSGADGAVVAVGDYNGEGRLHASIDGLSWPGAAMQTTQSLNGVVFGGNSFVVVGDGAQILQSFVGPQPLTNEWIKPTSGYWEEPFWSLGVLPSGDQALVAFRNPGWKALAIGTNATVSHADSLSINNLIIDAPTNSFNQLLLNWAGLTVPLQVRSNLTVGKNGSLVSHESKLSVGDFELNGWATFSDNSIAQFNSLNVDTGGRIGVQGGVLTVESNFVMLAGSEFGQDEGIISAMLGMDVISATFDLTNGSFQASSAVAVTEGGVFNQYGGTANFTDLSLSPNPFGASLRGAFYRLAGGEMHVPGRLSLNLSSFEQTGGTNRFGSLYLLASCPHKGGCGSSVYSLSEGLLSGGDTFMGRSAFFQIGGIHNVTNQFMLSGDEVELGEADWSTYRLSNGVFTVPFLWMYTFSAFDQFGGSATADTIWVTHRREEYSFNLGQHSMAIRGGTLSCRNIGITNTTDILQSGGSVIVSNQFSFLAIPYPAPFPIGGYIIPAFVFSGGTLSASNIEMHTTWRILGSSNTLRISNPGSLQLAGTLELNSADFPAEEHLGRFILANNSFISLPGLNSILKFAASSAENWNPGAFLIITNWTGSQAGGGSERLMFGANQSGLSASQLSQIQFHISTNRYPARILSTGEVVPLIPQSLEFSNTGGSLVLTWPANVWMLQTSTNVSGPYFDISNASPPYTTGLTTNRQQFFRLRLN